MMALVRPIFAEFAVIMTPPDPERITKFRKSFRSKVTFKRFGTIHDGAISYQEMKSGLKNSDVLMTDQEIETIFVKADVDGDGEVSLNEFVHILCPEDSSQE